MKHTNSLPRSVYAIRCVHNGKVYIGCSGDLELRMKSHLSDLKRGMKRSHGKPTEFQNDFNKYGKDGFEVYVLETNVKPELAREAEAKWILEYKATEPEYGYNIRVGEPQTTFGDIMPGRPPRADKTQVDIDRKRKEAN